MDPERDAVKPGSHAMVASEPGQDREVAALRTVAMCRGGAWVEPTVLGKRLPRGSIEGARLFFLSRCSPPAAGKLGVRCSLHDG